MRTLPSVISCLALSGLWLAGQAQTPAPATASQPKAATAQRTADRRAATYKGPKVVKDTKKLGHEFIRESKPAKQVSPVKQ